MIIFISQNFFAQHVKKILTPNIQLMSIDEYYLNFLKKITPDNI